MAVKCEVNSVHATATLRL